MYSVFHSNVIYYVFLFVQHQMIGKHLKGAGMRRCNMEMRANRAQQGPAIWTPLPPTLPQALYNRGPWHALLAIWRLAWIDLIGSEPPVSWTARRHRTGQHSTLTNMEFNRSAVTFLVILGQSGKVDGNLILSSDLPFQFSRNVSPDYFKWNTESIWA